MPNALPDKQKRPASLGFQGRVSSATATAIQCLSSFCMQELCKRGPCPRANHRRGLNLGGRTVSAATTVADPIGDLAALHQHFVRGRVMGFGFCHSDLLLTPANALRALSPIPAFQSKTHPPQGGCLSFYTPFNFSFYASCCKCPPAMTCR